MNGTLYQLDVSIDVASDWRKVRPTKISANFYQRQLDLIKRVVDQLHDKCMIMTTVFNPYHHGTHSTSEQMFDEHLRTDPDAVYQAMEAMAESDMEYIQACFEAGVHGIYYSVQGGEHDRFSEELYVNTIKKNDLNVIDSFKDRGEFNTLHLCGANMRLDHYADYPSHAINWDVKNNGITLKEGAEKFGRAVLGGINNRGPLVNGTPEEITAEVRGAIEQFGRKGLLLGADCTLPSGTPYANVRTAVKATY
jgi:uroporphyrinogen decarboxylase